MRGFSPSRASSFVFSVCFIACSVVNPYSDAQAATKLAAGKGRGMRPLEGWAQSGRRIAI